MNDNYELDVDVQIQLSFDKGYMNAKVVDLLSALSKKIDLLSISKKLQRTILSDVLLV